MITRKDITDTLKAQGTKVGKGDIVIIRTGFVPGYYELTDPIKKMAYVAGPHTGIGPDVVGWVDEMEIAAIAGDVRYEFSLAAQALNIPGAVGSPLNPIAVK